MFSIQAFDLRLALTLVAMRSGASVQEFRADQAQGVMMCQARQPLRPRRPGCGTLATAPMPSRQESRLESIASSARGRPPPTPAMPGLSAQLPDSGLAHRPDPAAPSDRAAAFQPFQVIVAPR